MRTAFINQLICEAEHNERIFLLVGDLGYSVVEKFAEKFPDRFRNVGIAEQNMAGVAAGLAMTGFNVYIYSIGNFPTLRCIEQIRNDIAYHKANVKIVAVGGGYAYGDLGATHHATEALGVMRTMPNMVVCSPSDPLEAQAITSISANYDGPMYIQLGKAGESIIHKNALSISIGDIVPLMVNNCQNAFILTGSLSSAVLKKGVEKDVDIYTLPFVKPINKEQLTKIARMYRVISIYEEHQLSCGVGSAVIEQINDLYAKGLLDNYPVIHRIAIPDCFQEVSGSQDYLRRLSGLL